MAKDDEKKCLYIFAFISFHSIYQLVGSIDRRILQALKVERYASGSEVLVIFAAIRDCVAMGGPIFFKILFCVGSLYSP
jgi:hypothetical protein